MSNILNPNSGRMISIQSSSAGHIDAVVDRLNDAHIYWWNQSLDIRIQIVRLIQQSFQDNIKELSHLISYETGKPYWESLQEVGASISKIDAAIQSIEYRCRFPMLQLSNKSVASTCRPFGVIGIIGPFNFPLHLPHGQFIPAFLMGNACVIKPSEYVSEITQKYLSIYQHCFSGHPCPVDILLGGSDIGNTLVHHEGVSSIFFTGSAHTGRLIESTCHTLRKPCALEMGGNNALILADASDYSVLLNHILISAFSTSGQRCSSARRLIISKQHIDIMDLLIDAISKLSIQNYPTKLPTFMGPVVLPSVVDNILYQSFEHSSTVLPSRLIQSPGLMTPRVEYVDVDYFSFDDELFGPIVFVYVSEDIEHAISLANNSRFGLTASIYTESEDIFKRCLRELRTGVINWNQPTTGASGMAPFGGVKQSGNYRPAGFSMIDHCFYPIASSQSSQIFPLDLPE